MDDGTFYLWSDANKVSEDFGVIGTRIVACTVENNQSESHRRERNADAQPAAKLLFHIRIAVGIHRLSLLLVKKDEPQRKSQKCGQAGVKQNGIRNA